MDLSDPVFLSKDGLKQNPSIWAWLGRVAVVLTRLQGLFCTAHWQRVTGADKRAGRSAKQECHHTTTAWLPWWLLPCGCWLLAAGCQLCLAMVTLGLPKAGAFFPQQPGWIELANSTVQFWIHLEVSSPVSDHQTQGVPGKTSGYRVYARSELTTSIPSAVPASWVWRTESLKEKISPWMVWKWGSWHNAWFPPEKDVVQAYRKHGTLQHAPVQTRA